MPSSDRAAKSAPRTLYTDSLLTTPHSFDLQSPPGLQEVFMRVLMRSASRQGGLGHGSPFAGAGATRSE